MKSTIKILIVAVLAWLFLKKSKTTSGTASLQTPVYTAPNSGPIPKPGLVDTATAPVIPTQQAAQNKSATITTADQTQSYRDQALTTQAEEQKKEEERLAAQRTLLDIQKKIDNDKALQLQSDADTLAKEQKAKEELAALNESKAIAQASLAAKNVINNKIQYEDKGSADIAKLNAILAVKYENLAKITDETVKAMIISKYDLIENYLRWAAAEERKGDPTGNAQRFRTVALLTQLDLDAILARNQIQSVSNKARQLSSGTSFL